jgi:hypothetical protein
MAETICKKRMQYIIIYLGSFIRKGIFCKLEIVKEGEPRLEWKVVLQQGMDELYLTLGAISKPVFGVRISRDKHCYY